MTVSITTPTGLEPASLRKAFGEYPSGVVCVAGHAGGQLVGIAASSFISVSLDPPLVSIAVAKTSNTWPLLREPSRLGVSVLADDHDEICRQLAGPAESRFSGLPVTVTGDGAVLLANALCAYDCSVEEEISAGDHWIVLLRLHAVERSEVGNPLVFHRSGFAGLHGSDNPRLTGRINGEPVAQDDDEPTKPAELRSAG